MLAGLLCSNHITYRFGKGMMPEAYRLNMNTMAVVMDNYANQLAEEYGQEVAAEILKQSRAKLESMPAMGYSTGAAHGHAKYDSLNNPKSTL
ncbi:hypothetical protein NLJ89_g4911 [Agrocybe chaxingu]|uniref:Uncharacterized protein n=1 Tax=Agrocybe chaxingu TaxID=84603 RepID=A0A9W8K260_9AGAR|nr:hypothetical protein NLJ89_g4911 [Agrocybe chaxingu]